MTISESQLRTAVFWEQEGICLNCGAEVDEITLDVQAQCDECDSPLIVDPRRALEVLENVERDEE